MNKQINRKKLFAGVVILLLLFLLTVRLNALTKTQLINRTGQTFERGVVTEILQDNL